MNKIWALGCILAIFPSFLQAQKARKVELARFDQSVLIYKWSPADGALGRYGERVAAQWKDSDSEGWLILLGQDNESIWTIEGHLEDDAHDFSLALHLARTYFDGERKLYTMPPERFKGDIQDAVLQQIWHWDKIKVLPDVDKLENIDRSYPEITDNFPGRALVVKTPSGRTLNWNFIFDTEMCWFLYKWEVF